MTSTIRAVAISFSMLLCVGYASAQPVKHQVTGLFMKEREKDLRQVFEKIPNVKLTQIDFANAEIMLEYAPFPDVKPELVINKLNEMLQFASNQTFGIKPLRTTPLDKLKLIEIGVAGLDCKACALVAYEAIYQIDGVERATASFRDGKVTALIDPEKTNRGQLEEALKKRGVKLKQ